MKANRWKSIKNKSSYRWMNGIQRTAVKLLAGFFTLMLLFTLVSRMSDGVTIARVEVDTIKSGDITNRTTIPGFLEPMEDRELTLPEGVYVTSVKVGAEERVKSDDVLLEFDGEDVREQLLLLQEDVSLLNLKIETAGSVDSSPNASSVTYAKKEYERAKEDYQRLRKKLNGASKRLIEDLEAAKTERKQAMQSYEKAVKKAKENLVAAEADKVSAAKETLAATKEAANEAVGAAQFTYDSAYVVDPNSLECARAKELLQSTKDKWDKKTSVDEKAVAEAEKELEKERSRKDVSDVPEVVAAKGLVESADKAVLLAKRAKEDNELTSEEQLLTAKRAIDNANDNLEKAKQDEEDKRNQTEMERLTYQMEKTKLEDSISLLEEIVDSGGRLKSPVDGTILSIAQVGKTQDKVPVAVISCDGLGFTFEGKVESKLAEELAAGDSGTLTYSSEGKQKEAKAVVTSIGAADEEDNVLVTAMLPEGSYLSGTTAEMTVEKKSERQTALLPIGALRGVANDEFVLVLKEKKTVMGTEHVVAKVPVTVLDSDNEHVSVESSLSKEDEVVVGSNKVIAEGDRVRLEKE